MRRDSVLYNLRWREDRVSSERRRIQSRDLRINLERLRWDLSIYLYLLIPWERYYKANNNLYKFCLKKNRLLYRYRGVFIISYNFLSIFKNFFLLFTLFWFSLRGRGGVSKCQGGAVAPPPTWAPPFYRYISYLLFKINSKLSTI